jgi:hypothetical protein
MPGPPAGGHTELTKVKVWLALMPYKSPAEHAAARERNQRLERKRLDFFKKHLHGIPAAHKGPPPPHPQAFALGGQAETRLVRRYALLWLATEPEQLPTHYYGRLAMYYFPDGIAVEDPQGAKQHDEIVMGLAKIVTAYETPASVQNKNPPP